MVRTISDCPSKRNMREITIEYDPDNQNDLELLKKISNVIATEQPLCQNCENFYYEGCFGNYKACSCKIHGVLEAVSNPHNDCDGSKCDDYRRKVGVSNG